MKYSYCAALLAVGLAAGFLVRDGMMEQTAHAQKVGVQAQLPRYQISAWGMANGPAANGGGRERGCYIVDVRTGALWHAAADGKPIKISQEMQLQ